MSVMELKEHLQALRKVTWTSEVFTAHDLNDKIAEIQMPIILKVVDGYYGVQHIETFSSDQILWIYGKNEQKRIIGIDKDDNHISIAYDTPLLFENKDSVDNEIVPQKLSDLLEENKFPVTVSFYAGDFSGKSINGTELSADSIGNLRITKEHSMTSLFGVCLQKDTIDSEIQSIPMYLDNRFSMATSQDEGSKLEFEKLKNSLEKMVNDTVNFESYTGSSDIIIYEKADMANQDVTNYNSLSPQKIKVDKVQRRKKKRESSGDKFKRFSLANMVSSVRKLGHDRRKVALSMGARKYSDDSQEELVETSFQSDTVEHTGTNTLCSTDSPDGEKPVKDKPDGTEPVSTGAVQVSTGAEADLTGVTPDSTGAKPVDVDIEKEPLDGPSVSDQNVETEVKLESKHSKDINQNAPGLITEIKNIFKHKTKDDEEKLYPTTNTEKGEVTNDKGKDNMNDKENEQSEDNAVPEQVVPKPKLQTKPLTESKPTLQPKPETKPKPQSKPKPQPRPKPQSQPETKPTPQPRTVTVKEQEIADVALDNNENSLQTKL
ncbi:uncharacterized protein [Antedon mediterranea]|uniref:uncharacterized protein n=1 Tax=Antedon mediterranea TaxID=105859 RepID=UPI003AF41AB0